jgi:hypothetical protein
MLEKYLTPDYWLTRDDIVCKTDEAGALIYLRVCESCQTSLRVCCCRVKTEGLVLVFDRGIPMTGAIQAVQDAANRWAGIRAMLQQRRGGLKEE